MDDSPRKQSVRPWKTLSSSLALNEKWMRIRKDVIRLPSGKVIDDYFVWESPHIVMVVPVTTDGKFVLVQQYRHAIGKIMLQFPAGAADPGETAELAGKRELEEEAGYTAERLIYLGSSAPYSTKVTDMMDIYLASDARLEGEQHYDEQEETIVKLMDVGELLALVDSGQAQPADLLASALLALRYFKRL